MQLPKHVYPPVGVPVVIGASGLTGRPPVRPPAEVDLEEEPQSSGGPLVAIPPPCLRSLSSPRGECMPSCPGMQRDGSCLCDIVRLANERGVPWRFEVDPVDGTWVYSGPSLG